MSSPSKLARHSLADLPVTWVTQVLVYCPVRLLFVCMRVSRSWAAAARTALLERRSLALVDSASDADVLFSPLDVLVVGEISMEALFKSLCLMSRLKHLQICSYNQRRVMFLTHETLVSLIAPFDLNLQFSKIVFPYLKRLECQSVKAACVPCFPSLRRLKLTYQFLDVDAIAYLNPALMTAVDVTFVTLGVRFASDLQLLVQAVKRLTRLTRLHLGIWNSDLHVDDFPDADSQPLLSLFDPFFQLEHVSISSFPVVRISPAIERLVTQNPRLESLSFSHVCIDEEMLNSISRLSRLRVLRIRDVWLSLAHLDLRPVMRNACRASLCEVIVENDFHWETMQEELQVMASERGHLLERKRGPLFNEVTSLIREATQERMC